MLTITISGERGEGKTFLAWAIMQALKQFTRYEIEIEYSETANAAFNDEENTARIEKYRVGTNMNAGLKSMQAKTVKLVVENK